MLDYDLAENDFKRARQAVQTHMVLRKAGYQGAVYRGQYKEKQRYPVIGAVLYWGKGHWNYPRDLKELMHEKLTARELDYVDDVHLDVYEMAHLPKDVRERFKSDMRIVVDYLAEGKYIPTHQKIVHVEDLLRMLREISKDDRCLDMIKNLTKKDKEEGVSMCELLDRYWNGGVEEGILLNLVELVRDGLLAMDEAVKRSKLTEEEFRKLL